MLYICGTPLGNLEDISYRVVRILSEVNLIAAEDTRHTIKLLNHYEIKTPLTSFHQHNWKQKAEELLRRLHNGENIALVTDAGMPCISDPGQEFVRLCHENNIQVTSAPSATAATTGLSLSGFSSEHFVFEGFLPRENKKRQKILNDIKNESRTVILYEAPHHLLELLRDLLNCVGNRRTAVIREMTKIHEEILLDDLDNHITHFAENPPRGEFVVILEEIAVSIFDTKISQPLISVQEEFERYLKNGWDKKIAMKMIAKSRGVGKREIYRELLEK